MIRRRIHRIARSLLLPAAVLLAGALPAAAAQSSAYGMEILVDGRTVEEHAARGRTYVEALEGREYTIRLRNHTGRRVAVALSVDGLNSIDAKATTAREATKWILGPYQTITIDGWQTSASTARKFFFTTEERSYGAWLGKTSNLGVISAAFFRERMPAPIRRAPAAPRKSTSRADQDAPSAGRSAGEMEAGASERRESVASEPAPSDDLAATGIGREVDHHVRRVSFRAESAPSAVVELRYEYRDSLVRLGVLPEKWAHGDDLERRERARGFEDLDFAPDPFRDR